MCYPSITDNLSVALFLRGDYMRIVKSAEERKNEILDVAEQLFAEKGFDHASTNDIINKIGIARGTLYHHFRSKEEILDALVERMTQESVSRARLVISDKSQPLLERLTGAIIALDLDAGAGSEVFEQIHKPQNALLHQKMQENLISGVVPLIADLIREGNETGLFDSEYPDEAAEMIIIYSNIAFDELAGLTAEQLMRKSRAFACHTERILGAKEGSLVPVIMNIINH